MRNGYGEVENGLSVLLVHVEKKAVGREDNFLQVMIKSLHNLHSKEKSNHSIIIRKHTFYKINRKDKRYTILDFK